MRRRVWKRCLAGVLTAATVLSSSNITYAAESLTAEDNLWSTTAAKIVAGEYFNSGSASDVAATAILNNEIINQGTIYSNITVPTAENELVMIDSEEKVVTATAFEKNGYVWTPVSVDVVSAAGDMRNDDLEFTLDGTEYVSEVYDAQIVSCTAEVTYELKLSFDEAAQVEQAGLAKIPEILAEGIVYFDLLETTASDLDFVNEMIAMSGREVGKDICDLYDGYLSSGNTAFEYLIANYSDIKSAASSVSEDMESVSGILSYYPDAQESFDAINANVTVLAAGCELGEAPEKVFAGVGYGNDAFEAIVRTLEAKAVTVKDEVTVATTVIEAKADVVTITVNVSAVIAADDVYSDLDAVTTKTLTYTDDFVLPKTNAGDPNLETALGTIKANAQNEISEAAFASDAWKEYSEKYNFKDGDLFEYKEDALEIEELTQDLVYNVSYEINTCSVTTEYDGKVADVPYGTKLMLPEHSDAAKDYDYIATAVDETSTYYNEGKVLTITKDLKIKRAEAAVKQTESLLKILSLDKQYTGLETVNAILTSAAVDSPSVAIRKPGIVAVSAITTDYQGNYSATAGEIESGVAGMIWKPVSARVMNGEVVVIDELLPEEVTTDSADVKESAFSWYTEAEYTHLEVQYVLDITSKSVDGAYVALENAEVLEYLNLSAELVAEVQEQNNILLNKIKLVHDEIQKDDNLKMVMKKTALETLKKDLSESGKAAIDAILAKGITGSELTLYTYLKYCAEGKWELSTYYSRGYAEVLQAQAELIAPQLNIIAEDANLGNALNKFGSYSEEDVAGIREDIKTFTAKLMNDADQTGLAYTIKGANEAFIMDDFNAFDKVIGEILAIDPATVPVFAEATGLKAYDTATAPAPKYGIYTITVQDVNGKTASSFITYEKENLTDKTHTVSSGDIVAINEVIVTLSAALGIDADNLKYYTVSSDVPAAETVVSTNHAVTYAYGAKNYEIPVAESEESLKFSGTESAIVTLPECDEDGYYYVYIVTEGTAESSEVVVRNGAGTYKISDMSAFVDAYEAGKNVITIKPQKYSVKTEAIDEFVNALNDAMKAEAGLKDENGNLLAAFVPVKTFESGAVNGVYESIVLRMDYSSATAAQSLMTAIGNAMVDIALSTPYVAFNNHSEKFLYSDEDGTAVDIQALIDLFLTSGLSSDIFTDIINKDGSVVDNVTFGENSVVVKTGLIAENAGLGGKIITSDIQLGNGADDCQSIPLYITLAGEKSEYLKGVRAFFEKIEGYANLEFADGKIAFEAALPNSAFTVYMSFMLMLGELSLDDINQDLKVHVEKLKDLLLADINLDNVTYEKVESTINGYMTEAGLIEEEFDFEPYKNIIERIINMVKSVQNKDISATIQKAGNQIDATLTFDIANLLGESVADFTTLLKGTTITIPMEFVVANLEKDIEAIVLDLGKSNIHKLSYVSDVVEALENAEGITYVVLTKNIEAKDNKECVLNITQPTILNLNGKDILGSINASAALRIVDSSVDTDGMVYGDITGNSVRIAAGKYPVLDADKLETMLHDTYVVGEDNYVTGKYYSVVEDENGNLTVELSSDFAKITEGNMQTLVMEMVSDLFFGFYNTASVSVDGNRIISADADFILDDLMAKDYASLAEALKGCIDTANVSAFVNELYAKLGDLNKIADVVEAGGVVASYEVTTADWGVKALVKDGSLGVSLKTDNAKTRTITLKFKEANPELAEALREFATIFKVTFDYSYDGITVADGKIDLKGSAHIAVELDLENEDGTPSDYITALAAILAYNEEDAEEREEIVKAINYYANNIYAGELKEEFEEMSIGELIDAVQKVGSGVAFEDVLRATGLRNLLSDTLRLEAKYTSLLEIAYNLVNAVEKGIAFTENKLNKDIFGMKLGGTKDLTEDGYWCTYGGDFNYSENFTIDVRMKMFAGSYVSPVDEVIKLLEKIPADTNEIYHVCDENCPEGCDKACDNREKYLDIVSAARAAYDALDDLLKDLIPEDLYNRLLAAEALYNNMGVWVAEIEDYNYTGKAIKPQVRVYHGSTLLTNKKDYTVTYKYNTSAAAEDCGAKAPRAIIKLQKNYKGTIYAYFTIKPIDLAKAAVDAEYRTEVGLEIKDVYKAATKSKDTANLAKPVVYLNGKKIEASNNYTFYYPQNPTKSKKEMTAYKTTGTYEIIVVGKGKNFVANVDAEGNPAGYTVYQHVANKNMSSVTVKLVNPETGKKATSFAYTGSKIEPTLVVTYKSGSKTYELIENVHFTVERTNNVNVGTATIILTGTENVDGSEAATNPYSFYGTKKITFKITTTMDISSTKQVKVEMLKNDGEKYVTKEYIGGPIELKEGVDYQLTAKDGTVLKLGKDYEVSYKNNTNAGTATIKFKGIGDYKGTVSKSFKISKANLDLSLLVTDKIIVVANESGGTEPTAEIKLQYENPLTGEVKTLKLGKDYTMKCINTTKIATEVDKAGNYVYSIDVSKQPKVTITGKGNFTGKFSLNYTIKAADFTVTANDVKYNSSKVYNYKTTVKVQNALSGKELFKSADISYEVWDASKNDYVDIVAEKDYLIQTGRLNSTGKKILFLNDAEKEEGIKMRAVGTGKNNYIGKLVYDEYRIYDKSINSSNTKVTVNQKFTYNKYTQTIDMSALEADNLVVKYKGEVLTYGEDYIIAETSYKNNLFAGTASVKIQGINSYGGTYTKKFIINKFVHNADSIALGNEDGVTLTLNGTVATVDNVNTLITVPYEKGGVKPAEAIKLTYRDPETGKTMELVYGRDYTLTWSNTQKAAAADAKKAPTVKIKGIGNFKGSITVKYTIERVE